MANGTGCVAIYEPMMRKPRMTTLRCSFIGSSSSPAGRGDTFLDGPEQDLGDPAGGRDMIRRFGLSLQSEASSFEPRSFDGAGRVGPRPTRRCSPPLGTVSHPCRPSTLRRDRDP